jgi:cell division protein ZapA
MTQVDVIIMDHAYKLSCSEGQEPALRDAVAYLDAKMCAIRDGGKVRGNDRIAVMAALGMAAELLATKAPEGPLSALTMAQVQQQIAAMHMVLDNALAPQENLF